MSFYSTPINRRYSSLHASSLLGVPGERALSEYRLRIARDMARQSVPLDVETFCKLLLPDPTDPRFVRAKQLNAGKNPFAALRAAKSMSEKDISVALLKAINDNELVPGCQAADCESRPDPPSVDADGQKIDTALFDARVNVSGKQPQWTDQEVPIKFTRDGTSEDPNDDKKENINTDASSRKENRNQITHYAELIMIIQQRLFLFMIVVVGRKFRILRWDRSGVIVSAAVDYYVNWKQFCNVLWRISLAHRFAPEMLGSDPSAVRLRPGDSEWKRMEAASEDNANDVSDEERVLDDDELPDTKPFTFKYVRDAFRHTLVDRYPRYKVEVPGQDKTHYFLICRPIFQAKGVAGRGTRGFIALEYNPTPPASGDPPVDHFVFLKDAWRMKYDGVRQEGDILAKLNHANVQYIPTLLCHGDIGTPPQETTTHLYWEYKHRSSPPESNNAHPPAGSRPSTLDGTKRKRNDQGSGSPNPSSPRSADHDDSDFEGDGNDSDGEDAFKNGCPLRRHVHYRHVVEEVGRSLNAAGGERKLLSVIVDCIEGHRQAFNLSILHRDISAGNILIYPRVEVLKDKRRVLRWVGLLTDWELSKDVDESPGRRQLERIGTWQFMSYGLLKYGSKVVELYDDLEAFFYVILYYAIRYSDSNCEDVATFLEDFFDCYTVRDDEYYVGQKKKTAMKHGEIEVKDEEALEFTVLPMNELVYELLESFSAHHKILRYEARLKAIPKFNMLPPPAATTPNPDVDGSKDADIFFGAAPSPRPRETARERRAMKKDEFAQPTPEERALSKNVTDHDEFLGVVRHALFSPHWSSCGSAWKGDRVSPERKSSRKLGPVTKPATDAARKKRQKMDRFTEVLSSCSFVSAPPQPGQPSKASGSKHGSGRRRGTQASARTLPAANQYTKSLRSRK